MLQRPFGNFRSMQKKNFRKRSRSVEEDEDKTNSASDDEEERRSALEEVKFLQKQRERKAGMPAMPIFQKPGAIPKPSDKHEADGEKEELVLQDTFAQETAVMAEWNSVKPLNCVYISTMEREGGRKKKLKTISTWIQYVEQELAKKRGRNVDAADHVENDGKRAEDELYEIPEHLKVKRRNSEESSTQWTTGIAEVQLPIEMDVHGFDVKFVARNEVFCLALFLDHMLYKLRNIEETEAAKKLLQEKRFMGKAKAEMNTPSSYSADYFQWGRDYAEKLRREHPELYKDKGAHDNSLGSSATDTSTETAGRRQAATDEFMLERFRKWERQRVMRR
ncbi:Telomere length and silencing protein 1 [Dillenia turbinata]|uniref:Telomere length and silencing protein 1 n=1 Tax=Dillenia turbinata TaxID=194707 RepID=A0AAN8Z259_9MAGN